MLTCETKEIFMKLKFDINKYKKIKETSEYQKIKTQMLESKTGLDYNKVSLLCATSALNIIAVYFFLREDVPEWVDECNNKIECLMDFYGYED